MPIQSFSIGSQNNEEPQVEQNPRRTFSDERNQPRRSAPWMVTAARGTSVDTKTCPDHLRHCEQWQASGPGNAPLISKLTAPQRQDPLCMAFLISELAPLLRTALRGTARRRPERA